MQETSKLILAYNICQRTREQAPNPWECRLAVTGLLTWRLARAAAVGGPDPVLSPHRDHPHEAGRLRRVKEPTL